ncbi:glycosyltransferase [Lysinibacillus piscis]|uniref:Glycosyl transferase family protein n=1 Tax=Lysinibacillus piscis TaxID=2518931 RepID=A0ABQ5NHI0_9BACI|nr:glycosyltransferase [Lysinibacillus sp. KH24]GLC87807.1 glycosyl transferase family protein [Lysinibacillus sp. KH24]
MNVSIIIPVYNVEKYIASTLDSLIAQTYPIDEILVIDDCGDDCSVEVVKEYSKQHSNIRIIQLPYNQGVSAARNKGLQESRNEWVLLMDADDTIHPNLVKYQVSQLMQHENTQPKPVCVHPAYIQIDSEGKVLLGSEYYGQQLSFNETFGTLLVRNYIITASGLLVNRKEALNVGGYNTNLSLSEDYEFLLRLSRQGTFVYLNKAYVNYRRHLKNTSSSLKKMEEAGKAVLDIYSIDEIKEAIFCRSYSEQKNLMDFVTLLYQYQQYDEGFNYLAYVTAGEFEESKLFYQALYYIEKHQEENAVRYLDRLINLNENHGAALNNRGVCYAKAGNIEAAQELFEQALEQFPGYMDATDNLSVLADGKKEYCFTKRELRKNLLRYS